MYEVLSFLHVKVLAMSESGNIARKGSAMSSFPLYDSHGIQHPRVGVWRFFSVEVDPKPLCGTGCGKNGIPRCTWTG